MPVELGEEIAIERVARTRGIHSADLDAGHAAAQFNLGVMYDFGWGVPQDDVEAVAWTRQAAEQGDASKDTQPCRRPPFRRSTSL